MESEPARKASDTKGAGSKGKTKAAKGRGPIAADEPTVKKVLIEETPTLDTYETRQRARLIMGSVAAFCLLLFIWVVYSVFRPDSGPTNMTADSQSVAVPSGAGNRPSLDQEARYMFNRRKNSPRRKRPTRPWKC